MKDGGFGEESGAFSTAAIRASDAHFVPTNQAGIARSAPSRRFLIR